VVGGGGSGAAAAAAPDWPGCELNAELAQQQQVQQQALAAAAAAAAGMVPLGGDDGDLSDSCSQVSLHQLLSLQPCFGALLAYMDYHLQWSVAASSCLRTGNNTCI
jgi:hypothetical protein